VSTCITSVPGPRGSGWGRPINDAYFDRVAQEFPDRVRVSVPTSSFWYFGFDTHQATTRDIGSPGRATGTSPA